MKLTSRPVDEQVIERQLLDPQTYRSFARPNVWRWLAAVSGEWLVIGLTLWACMRWPHWWLWLAGIFLIGTRQHALGIMAHEGVHFLISRTRFWNDLLGNYLAAYPLTYSVQGYRTNHLLHHRWLETARDPERATIDCFPEEWTYPMRARRFFWLLLRDMIGGSQRSSAKLISYIWRIPGGIRWQLLQVVGYHAVVATVAIATGHLWTYVVLWLVPLLTVAIMCFRVRTAAEHSAIGRSEDRYTRTSVDTVATTRTTIGGPLTQFLFGPHNMSYHIEHHLYPTVPVFRLRALHAHLMRNPDFASRARVAKGYGRLVGELTR